MSTTTSDPAGENPSAGKPFHILAEMAAVFLAAFAVLRIGMPLAAGNAVAGQAVVWIANVVMLAVMAICVRLRGAGPASLGLAIGTPSWPSARRLFLRTLIALVLAVAAFVSGSVVMANITGIPEPADMSGYGYLRGNLPLFLLTLAGVYLVSSLGEEVVYRGYLLNRLRALGLRSKAGTAVAIGISAIVFGIVHYSWGPMGMVQTGCMGAVLAMLYVRWKNDLWPLVLAHAVMDTILMVQLYSAAPA